MELQLCRMYMKNKTEQELLLGDATNKSENVFNHSVDNKSIQDTNNQYVSFEWFEIVIPIVCMCGIFGNILNLAVLTRRRHTSGMDSLGRTANCGLVALAFSDLLFCLTVFPHTFITTANRRGKILKLLVLYYRLFGVPSINLFIMISTWLIVNMAIKRLLVVVYPLHARDFITTRRTYILLAMVYVASVILTAPNYLHNTVRPCLSPGGATEYQFRPRWGPTTNRCLKFYIRWVWPVLADFVPVVILIVCNYRLIKELRTAKLSRQSSCPGQQVKDSGQRVTLILVIIVLMLLVLVAPSEVLKYINPYRAWGKTGHMVASITNVLQTVNFAFNFLLYFTVSSKFRSTARSLFQSRGCSSTARESSYSSFKMLPRGSPATKSWTLRGSSASEL